MGWCDSDLTIPFYSWKKKRNIPESFKWNMWIKSFEGLLYGYNLFYWVTLSSLDIELTKCVFLSLIEFIVLQILPVDITTELIQWL